MRIFFLLFFPSFAIAQKNVINQNLNYFRLQFSCQATKNWTIKHEIENRSYFLLGRQNQFILNLMAERILFKNNLIGFGFAYSKATTPQDPDATLIINTLEARPYLYYSHQERISKKQEIKFRIMQDFRFFKKEDECYQYGNLRPRIMLEYNFNISSKFTLRAFDEVLFNALGRTRVNTFDQNRIGASTQFNINKNNSFEIGYANWYQKQKDGFTYLNKNICRVTYQKRLQL